MQLSDVLGDANPITEALNECLFQERLKRLSDLPDSKKREIEKMWIEEDFRPSDVFENSG